MVIHPYFSSLLLLALLTGLDLWQKHWAMITLSQGQTLPLVPGLLQWRLIFNTGGPWSVFNDHPQWLLVTGLLTIALIVVWWVQTYRQHPRIYWPFVLITAGALGNITNRLMLGAVVDSIELIPIAYPVFNLADSFICIGLIGWLLSQLNQPDNPAPAVEAKP